MGKEERQLLCVVHVDDGYRIECACSVQDAIAVGAALAKAAQEHDALDMMLLSAVISKAAMISKGEAKEEQGEVPTGLTIPIVMNAKNKS